MAIDGSGDAVIGAVAFAKFIGGSTVETSAPLRQPPPRPGNRLAELELLRG